MSQLSKSEKFRFWGYVSRPVKDHRAPGPKYEKNARHDSPLYADDRIKIGPVSPELYRYDCSHTQQKQFSSSAKKSENNSPV